MAGMAHDIITMLPIPEGDNGIAEAIAAVVRGDREHLDLEGHDRRSGTPVTVRIVTADE